MNFRVLHFQSDESYRELLSVTDSTDGADIRSTVHFASEAGGTVTTVRVILTKGAKLTSFEWRLA